MSRIGRMPVVVPSGVEVAIDGPQVTVKGPKGTLSHTVVTPITVEQNDGVLTVTRPDDERDSRARHGLTRTLVNNMVVGVTEGYEKKLEIVGVGYRVLSKGPTQLEFQLGYSHSITVQRARGHHLHRGWADPSRRPGHRQAAGRRGRCEHPQAPQARALQGQGRALRRRTHPPQGRKGW